MCDLRSPTVILSFFLTSYASLSFCAATDISATVTPIGVNFCVMAELSSGHVFPPFDGDIFRGHQMRGQAMGSQIPIFAI